MEHNTHMRYLDIFIRIFNKNLLSLAREAFELQGSSRRGIMFAASEIFRLRAIIFMRGGNLKKKSMRSVLA